MPTFEYVFDTCTPDFSTGFNIGGAEWGSGTTVITGVRAKLSTGTGTFNFSTRTPKAQPLGAIPPDERVGELIWHFRAEDLGTPAGASDGDVVSIWYSYNKALALFRQTTTAEKPLYKTALGPNNNTETVLFDGSDDQLEKYSGTTTLDGDWTAFIVIGDLSTTNPAPLLGETDGSDANVSLYGRDSRMQIRDTDGNMKQTTSLMPAADEIRCIQFTGDRVYEYVDGEESYSNATGPSEDFEWDTIGGMTNSAKSIFMDGGISEIMMFEGKLGTEERQIVEGYLAHKWGLTGSITDEDGSSAHPHVGTDPASIPYMLGADLVLSSTYPSVTTTGVSVAQGDTVNFFLTKCQNPGTLTVELTYDTSPFTETASASDAVVIGRGLSLSDTTESSDVLYNPKAVVFSFGPGP